MDLLVIQVSNFILQSGIYNWRNKYIREGVFSLMDENRKKRTQNVIDSNDVDQLKQQLYELQMEVDILKETLNVIKKDPGVDWKDLKNREKVAVIDAMKEKYPLPILLRRMELSRSSYYYQIKAFAAEDK